MKGIFLFFSLCSPFALSLKATTKSGRVKLTMSFLPRAQSGSDRPLSARYDVTTLRIKSEKGDQVWRH